MAKLEGKVALITGAAVGLGEGIAEVYAKYGAKMCMVDLSPEVEKTADRLRKEYGADIITYVGTSALQFINGDLDVNDDAVWNDYVAKIESMNIGELTEIIQTAYDRANG